MKKTSKLKDILEWTITIGVAILLAAVLNLYVIVNATIPTASMENTIMTGDRIIGSRLAYVKEKAPARGDVVIFRYPDDEKILFIKRVIGLPGETLEIRRGEIFINGSETPMDEPYLQVIPEGNYGPYMVPEGSYFMMGDNRNRSEDSRFWRNTFLKEEKIVGKALFCYYPSIHKIK